MGQENTNQEQAKVDGQETTTDTTSLKPKPAGWKIKNDTPRYVLVKGACGTLELPPLATRVICNGHYQQLDELLHKLEEIHAIKKERASEKQTNVKVSFLSDLAKICVIAVFIAVFAEGSFGSLGRIVATGAMILLITPVAAIPFLRHNKPNKELLASIWNRVMRLLNLVLVTGVVVVSIGVLIYIFREELPIQETLFSFFSSPVGMARILQMLFIVIASLLPALLYFLFHRQRFETVEIKFMEDMLRLDPDVWTMVDARTKYQPLFEETYGSFRSFSLLGSGLPILLATLLILLGWILVLLPFGPIEAPLPENFDLLFMPRQTVVTFAFLGAYYFAIGMAFRRYVRSDLTPKAYTQMILRILLAIILAWILATLTFFFDLESSTLGIASATALYAVVFFAAIFPDTGILLIREFLQRRLGSKLIGTTSEEHPLTCLEGVNLYDQARLLEEGIENVANLAHHDLTALILNTRLPTERIVDLFDQAILYLHLGLKSQEVEARRKKLLKYGIRTATDLERAHQAAKMKNGNVDRDQAPNPLEGFLSILDEKDNCPNQMAVLLSVILVF
jgi:hypothetical protein